MHTTKEGPGMDTARTIIHYIGRSTDGVYFHAQQTDTLADDGQAVDRDWFATDLDANDAEAALSAAIAAQLVPAGADLADPYHPADDPGVDVYYEVDL